jgi:hypothetical protein|tara:strand:- start:642 stop:863 length:222 start_codon:yes stop_codon:yes gene_type:complete
MDNRFDDYEEQAGKVNLRISPELRKELKQFSLDTGKPMQAIGEYFLKLCLYAAKNNPSKDATLLDVELDIDNI